MLKEIGVNLLVPHPENCNHMEAETSEKIKRHIMRTGNYEPLTVRPHPEEKGNYQVINGHHRLKVLKELGHQAIKCTVWNIDDDQTRIYLATLNRLTGKDIPERRAMLLENLLGAFDVAELSDLLPDPRKQIEEISRLAGTELENMKSFEQLTDIKMDVPIMLSFMLSEPEAATVNDALDAIISKEGEMIRGKALTKIAAFYLHNQPIEKHLA